VPPGRPGRGLVTSKLHFLGALPRIDGSPDTDTLGDGVESMLKRVSAAWKGPQGPKLRLLPERVELQALVAQLPAEDGRLLIGINEKELAPTGLDPETQPHFLIYGDGQSGKSATLRAYLREVVRTHSPQEAQLCVVDYRRSLLGEVPEDYLLNYLTSANQATPTIKDLAAYLESRLPGPDVTPDQLRTRSWWKGAEVYVVIDDYDLVSTQQSSPIAPLQPLMAQSRDVGLHVVVARRSGGAGRASYEAVLQSMRELAMPGLMLSGSPDEGVLIASIKPQPLPPGRGRLWTRERGVEVVQVGWTDPAL
jgi:S-DNA-T family DNA segregation ATPase FtsK/SpoIIIE